MTVAEILLPSPPSTSSCRKNQLAYSMGTDRQTPTGDSSPFVPSSTLGSGKRVDFSPYANVHNPIDAAVIPPPHPSVRSLPRSRDCQLSSKPILKQNITKITSQSFDGQIEQPQSATEKLEAAIRQLGTAEHPTCVSAYQSIASVIRSQEELPDEVTMKAKMHIILKYIRRDLSLPEQLQMQPAEINVVTQALKVLVLMVWNNNLSVYITEELRAAFLDRSIQILADHTAAKSVILHYLHFLASQNFRSGLLTSNQRASRLLDALKGLTDHVKGNGAVAERLLVYHKLLDQVRSIMRSKATTWVEELLSALVHPLKDTRIKAINLGMKACSMFPPTMAISMSVRQALAREIQEGRTLSSIMCKRLEKMAQTKDELVHVPQIWAIVCLLVNNESPIDMWNDLKNWLKVLQKPFNCSDIPVRQQANMAWNRFVYISKPHSASDFLISMLVRPIIAQLERSSSDKTGVRNRPAAVSSYCNLLYYAFRPAATHKQYTRSWNEFIVKVMRRNFFEKCPANADIAARVFMSLFWNSTNSTKVWNDNRAHENTLVEPEELPVIDCKWIRSKTSAILEMFGLIFKYSAWGPSEPSDQAHVSKAWSHFLKAIREAAVKEIKASNETQQAVSSIVEFLETMLRDTSELTTSPTELQRRHILNVAISELTPGTLLSSLEQDPHNATLVLLHPGLAFMIENGSTKRVSETDSTSSTRQFHQTVERYCHLFNMILMENLRRGPSCTEDEAHAACDIIEQLIYDRTFAPFKTSFKPCLEGFLRNPYSFLMAESACDLSWNSARFIDLAKEILRSDYLFQDDIIFSEAIFLAAFESESDEVMAAAHSVWKCLSSTHDNRIDNAEFSQALERARIVRITMPLSNGSNLAAIPRPDVSLSDINAPHSPRILTPQEKFFTKGRDHQTSNNSGHKIESSSSITRLRHDDSQVQFVAIESSPFENIQLDSQILTDRQKEVRDRRRNEPAIVFLDLRSSPRRAIDSAIHHGDCELARRAAALQDRPSTPILAKTAEQADDDPLSSPTPKGRSFVADATNLDIPSSPLSAICDEGGFTVPSLNQLIASTLERHRQNQEVAKSPRSTSVVMLQGEPQSHSVISESMPGDGPLQQHEEDKAYSWNNDGMLEHMQQSSASEEYVKENVQTQESRVPHVDVPQGEDGHTVGDTPLVTIMNADEKPEMTVTDRTDTSTEGDSVDNMIASQLSNDLDSYIELSSQIPDSQIIDQPVLDEPQPAQDPAEKKRKRSCKPHRGRPSKRRWTRSSSRASDIGSLTEEVPPVDVEVEQVFDCIEVQTQSHPPSGVIQDAEDGPVGLPSQYATAHSLVGVSYEQSSFAALASLEVEAKVGEPANEHAEDLEEQKPEVVVNEAAAAVGLNVAGIDARELASQDARKTRTNPLFLNEKQASSMQDLPHSLPTPTDEAIPTIPEPLDQSVSQIPTSDVVLALQSALSQLRSGQVKSIDLRAVEDLCFHIRCKAQDIAEGKA